MDHQLYWTRTKIIKYCPLNYRTSLLAREDNNTADIIEAEGQVTTLLGLNIDALKGSFPELEELTMGATFFKFILPDANGAIFPSGAAPYDPLADYQLDPLYGRISGEAGVVPEPTTMSLLALGGLAVLRRRRKQ